MLLKSKKLSLIAVLALLGATLVAPPAWAEDVNCTTGSFTVTDNVITGNSNCAGEAVIPNTVTAIGNRAFNAASALETVTFAAGSALSSIANNAFDGATSLTSITIPNSVTSIGSYAFNEATALTSITIPNSVTSMGTRTFKGATALKTVTFGAGSALTSIGLSAFDGATSLTSITIPNSITSIGSSAFEGATSLISITFEGNAPTIGTSAFSSVGANAVANIGLAAEGFGTATTWNGLTIVRTVACTTGSFTVTDNVITGSSNCAGEAVIPNSVTSIGNSAFYNATSLAAITIPNSVTSIGNYAFDLNTSLASVTFESDSLLTSIGAYAFGNTSLASITIPNSVTSIGAGAFNNASALTSIIIPNSVTSIGNYAFDLNTSLASVTFESDSLLTSIGAYAFGNTSLASITIPNSVTSIGAGAFFNTTSLTSITIPNSVTSIGNGAFNNASALTSIIIPNSVTSIGGYAFYNSTSLTSVTFEGNAPATVGTSAFLNVGTDAVANIGFAATDFGEGTTWNGLTIVRASGRPEVTRVTDYNIYEGFKLELFGTDLDTVIGLQLRGSVYLKIDSKSATSIITTIPGGIAAGEYSLYIIYAGGTQLHLWPFTMQAPITPVISDELKAWTKNLNDGTAKIYAKNIVGAGKIRFMLNGEEIAWVRAVSAADPKLRTANGAHYLVRTVDLVEGQKNILEVYLDGVRIKRTAYSY